MRAALLLFLLVASAAADEPDKPRYRSTIRARPRASTVEASLPAAEARRAAGTQGDALRVIENLPGVARAPFSSGQLVVWGAAPADTRVYVEGVEIPSLYHVGGLRGAVNDELVRAIHFSPGGYGAAYGHALGGLVRLDLSALPASGVHGVVSADVLDAAALVSAALGPRVQVAVAGRYSYLDRILARALAPDAGDFFPIPRYDDYQLVVRAQPTAADELAFVFLGADDRLTRAIPSPDPGAARTDTNNASMYRAFARWTRDSGAARAEVTPSFGWDDRARLLALGGTPARLEVASYRYGVRAQLRRAVSGRVTLTGGVDVSAALATVTRLGSLTLPPREGDLYVFGEPPPRDLAADRYRVHTLDAAPFVALDLALGPVTITPGLRLDAIFLDGDHATAAVAGQPPIGFSRLTWAPDPRLAVSWRAHPRATLALAGGLYHQPPDPVDLSPVFGNPTLGAARAAQATLSATVALTRLVFAEAALYGKWLDGLAARSTAPTPPVGRALVDEGVGASFGGQILVRAAPWRGLSGWLSYSVSRSLRRDHPDGDWRLFDFDQTHVLAAVASYQLRSWSFGARFRWSSGYPRTPVTGAYYDAAADRFVPRFGAQNSERLPDFVQLDLRVDKTFTWARAALSVYLDVENVTYRRNAEEVAYSEDFAKKSYVSGLPTLAVLGVKVRF